MAPPPLSTTYAFASVKPDIETVRLLLTMKIRTALFPLTVITLAPGPVIVMFLVTLIVLPSTMVPVKPGAKVMVSPFQDLVIASRSEQSLTAQVALFVSASFVTTRVVGVGVLVGVRVAV